MRNTEVSVSLGTEAKNLGLAQSTHVDNSWSLWRVSPLHVCYAGWCRQKASPSSLVGHEGCSEVVLGWVSVLATQLSTATAVWWLLSFLWGQSSWGAGFSSQLIQRGTGNCGGLEVFVGREGVLRNFSLSPISYPLDTFLAQTQLRITASPREKQEGENLRVRNSRLRGCLFFFFALASFIMPGGSCAGRQHRNTVSFSSLLWRRGQFLLPRLI